MTLMSKKIVTFLPAYEPREEKKELELEEPEEPEPTEVLAKEIIQIGRIIELLKRNRAAKDEP
jgi:hypothetical protein